MDRYKLVKFRNNLDADWKGFFNDLEKYMVSREPDIIVEIENINDVDQLKEIAKSHHVFTAWDKI